MPMFDFRHIVHLWLQWAEQYQGKQVPKVFAMPVKPSFSMLGKRTFGQRSASIDRGEGAKKTAKEIDWGV